MAGLLKTLLFILLFYYAFKFLARLFAPFLVKKMADTIQKKAAQQFGGQQPKNTVKEGETIIDKAPKNNEQSKNTVGEYVDFEEIE
ncbi:DUF4834 family protein [uncultured Polaribacter sp.]|uniref:DUF4834 family protein n=1 Tax=uncultured Polaribacter sp. TaxID=174711 RepID=UPI0026251387|nr:DUF4834 family protein [uncultured Polaribacter sp.]